MQNDFISYPLALRLKALGYDEPCFGYYDHTIKELDTISSDVCERLCKHHTHIKAPTFSQAFRWFREKYGVSVYISPLEDGSAFYHMVYTNINVPYSNRICSLPSKWNTYEEAELACLEKLIEIVEHKQKE